MISERAFDDLTREDVDEHIGKRLRRRRRLLGLTQNDLAQLVGRSFQQIQKYESAASRLTDEKLYDLASVLNVNVGYFFDGLPAVEDLNSRKDFFSLYDYGLKEEDIQSDKGFLKLAQIYNQANHAQRSAISKAALAIVPETENMDLDLQNDKNPPSSMGSVGRRIRQERVLLGQTLKELEGKTGLEYRHIQKIETVQNTVYGAHIYNIAHALGRPIGYFFNGFSGEKELPHESEVNNFGFLMSAFREGSEKDRHAILAVAELVAADVITSGAGVDQSPS